MTYQFTNKENLRVLFELLTENNFYDMKNIIDNNNIKDIEQINNQFIENIKYFYDKEKYNNNSLLELNKKFIIFMFQKGNFNIDNELITNEDIKYDKLNKFEKEYESKKTQFINYITPKIPTPPIFTDTFTDEPIYNIDELINNITKQRDDDLQLIHKNNIVNEIPITNKIIKIENENIDNNINNIIELDDKNKKKVSWDFQDNQDILQKEDYHNDNNINNNLFIKLKKQPNKIDLDNKEQEKKEEEINLKVLYDKISKMNDNIILLINTINNK